MREWQDNAPTVSDDELRHLYREMQQVERQLISALMQLWRLMGSEKQITNPAQAPND